MAKRKAKPTFRITKRFEVWVETVVEAESLETALVFAKGAALKNFLVPDHEDSSVIDETCLLGIGVSEEF